jgi:carbonic anhydrase
MRTGPLIPTGSRWLSSTVHADVELLRKAPELAGSIGKFRIGGHAHDLKTGLLTTVVDPS